jgi:hypothetical protein
VLGGLILGTLNRQRTDRWFGPAYLATLAPPGFRLAPGVPPRQFVDEMAGLRQRVDGLAQGR